MPCVRVLVAVTFLLLACASCSATDDDPTVTPTESATTTPSPSPSVPSDLSKYTPDERAAYQRAVRAYSAFTKGNAQFLARGETTRAASDFYHRYSIDWVQAWTNLAQLANNDVTVSGPTRVVWVHPKSIKLDPSGSAVVVLRRCLDESHLEVTQAGKRLDQPQYKYPHVYEVRLAKKATEDRWRSGSARQGASC